MGAVRAAFVCFRAGRQQIPEHACGLSRSKQLQLHSEGAAFIGCPRMHPAASSNVSGWR
jgi:hypothetical protein